MSRRFDSAPYENHPMSSVDSNPALEAADVKTASPAQAVIDRPMPLWRMVLLLAVPWWTQQFLHLAVSLFDALLAGRFLDVSGEQNIALQAAQTTGNYLSWFITNYAVLVSAGSTALVAWFVGAKDRAGAVRATNQSLLLALVFGVAGAAAGLIWTPELVGLLQLDREAGPHAVAYLLPTFIGLPLQVVEAVAIACLIGAGDTVTGMWVMSGVAVVNMPLAWAFSQGWWGLPAMGFVGISTGTALSHALGCAAVLMVLARGRAGLRLDLSQFRPNWNIIHRVLRISVPAGIDALSVGVGQLVFLGVVNQLGKDAGAAHGIALRWEALGYMSGGAFGVAAMALVGQNLGARRIDQAARSAWTAFGMASGVMILMGVVFFVLARPMFELFCPQAEQQRVIELGVPVLRLVAWAMPPLASCIIFTYALRGAGDTRVPVLITWLGFFGVRIPLAVWLTQQLDWGLLGAWWAMFADLLVRGLAIFWRFRSGKWRGMRI